MTQTSSSNIAQIEYWNTKAGETWAKFQDALDRQIETLGLAAMDTLKLEGGEHIIDIGCGCGQTSLDLWSRVGAAGSVVGVDISESMLEVALRRLRRAPNLRVTFRLLDAQSDDLGDGRFDAASYSSSSKAFASFTPHHLRAPDRHRSRAAHRFLHRRRPSPSTRGGTTCTT